MRIYFNKIKIETAIEVPSLEDESRPLHVYCRDKQERLGAIWRTNSSSRGICGLWLACAWSISMATCCLELIDTFAKTSPSPAMRCAHLPWRPRTRAGTEGGLAFREACEGPDTELGWDPCWVCVGSACLTFHPFQSQSAFRAASSLTDPQLWELGSVTPKVGASACPPAKSLEPSPLSKPEPCQPRKGALCGGLPLQ